MEGFVDFALASHWAYALLFGIAAVDAVFPVVPSEAAAIAAGVLSAAGELDLGLVVAAAALGAFVGDNTAYQLGRQAGRPALRKLCRSSRARKRIDAARRLLESRGSYLIVVARFIPGGRSATMLTAGLLRFPLGRFLLFAAVAAALWGLYAAVLGYIGGQMFVDNHWYGLFFALGLAGGITLAVEGYRRFHGAARRA